MPTGELYRDETVRQARGLRAGGAASEAPGVARRRSQAGSATAGVAAQSPTPQPERGHRLQLAARRPGRCVRLVQYVEGAPYIGPYAPSARAHRQAGRPTIGSEDARIAQLAEGRRQFATRRRLAVTMLALVGVAAVVVVSVVVEGSAVPVSSIATSTDVGAAARPEQRVQLTVEPSAQGEYFPAGSVGLSIEADEIATQDLNASHRTLVALMRQLGPSVLRLGGISVDYSWWTSEHEIPPRWAKTVITPADLLGLRRLLIATGWRAILGVDFGHFAPFRASDEAKYAARILGSRLLGVEIGNEPDAYGHGASGLRPRGYDVREYLAEVSAYSSAIRAAVPTLRLYGPDLASTSWLADLAAVHGNLFNQLTQHYYPTSYSVSTAHCTGTPVPTAVDLLSPRVRLRESNVLREIASAGSAARRPTRISETNSTGSCDVGGGPKTSPVFASALWALDWVLRAASAGVKGLNFHGYFGRCAPAVVSPICAPSAGAERRGEVAARPVYFGLLAASQLQGGQFVSVASRGGTMPVFLTAYASLHDDGRLTVAIDDTATRGRARLELTAAGYKVEMATALTAPSISATTGVRLATGAVYLPATHGMVVRTEHASQPTFAATIEPGSAVIVTMRR